MQQPSLITECFSHFFSLSYFLIELSDRGSNIDSFPSSVFHKILWQKMVSYEKTFFSSVIARYRMHGEVVKASTPKASILA